jgi:hypothetical protein
MTQTQLKEDNKLREQVKHIAETLRTGHYETDDECGPCASEYLKDALDIQYIISSDKQYLGARVLVAFGGPNIWINTQTQTVEGYWWGDTCHISYLNDALGLDEYLEEFYNCI